MNGTKIKLWLLWLAFLGGLLITGLGIWQAIDGSGMFAGGDVVEAIVVDTIPADDQHDRSIPILQWSGDDGGIHRLTATEGTTGLQQGDTVAVLFDPINPAASRIRSIHAIPPSSLLSILAGIALSLLAAVRLRRDKQ